MVSIANTDRLLALFIGAIATGIYLCTLFYCIRWLVYTDEGWRIRKKIHWPMLSGTLSLFVLSSIHISLAASTSFQAIRDTERGIIDTGDDGGRLPWTDLVMCTVSNFCVLIADGFLIYRCWMVCLKSVRIIIFPCFFWIGGFACTILQIYWQVVQTALITSVWTPVNMNVGPGTILTPFWGSTIVVNIYATTTIVYVLWKNAQAQSKHSTSTGEIRLVNVMRVIIESGAIYLLITIPHFIVWWTTSTLAIVILGWTNLPVVGSAFNLILIRTSRYRVNEGGTDSTEKMGKSVISAIQFSGPNSTVRTKDDISSTDLSNV
jgi:hypothetical protein